MLEAIASSLKGKHPHLKVNYVPYNSSAWIVVHRPDMAVISPHQPPMYDPHLVLALSDGEVTYDFRALAQSIEKGSFSWEKVQAHLDTLRLCIVSRAQTVSHNSSL